MDQSPYPGTRTVVGALFAMLLSLAATQAQTFPTAPINLSGTSHAEIPAVAVGPSGDINVVWLDSGDSGAILFRRSPGGGANFSGTILVATTNLPSQSSQPQIAVNSAGVYVAWAGTNNGQGDIFFSSLASGANIWALPVNVSNGKGIAPGGSAPVPRIAVDPSGGVDVVWGQNGAFFRRSPDGASFPSQPGPVPLTGSAMAQQSPRMAINSQGHVFVVWEDADPNFPNSNCPTISFARSTNGGASFKNYSVDDTLTTTSGQRETGCTSDVHIATRVDNTIWLLWANESPIQDLIITYAPDDDTSFSGSSFPEVEFENLAGPAAHTPQMAIDASGDIDVVWIGDDKQNDPNEIVYFSRSTDPEKGGTFCGGPNDPGCPTPSTLTSAPRAGALPTGFPQIAAEPSGAIDILWQQASATNPNNAYDIVLARSTDGANFQPFTLDNSPTVTGNTGQVAVDGSGAVYAMWTGNSGSSANIFLSGDSMALTDAGFDLTISTASQAVLPGATVTYNVTVNASGGFNQSVTLSCSNPPAGATCSFNPPTVTLSTSAASSTLTVSLPATIASGSYSVNVVGTSGGTTQSISTVFVVSGVTGSIAPASATISVGGSASFTVSLNSTNGFSGPVTLTCGGAPIGVSCSFNPSSVTVPGSAILNVSVSVKPSGSAVQRWPGAPGSPLARKPMPMMTALMWAIAVVAFLVTLVGSKRNISGASMQGSRRAGLNGFSYKTRAFARPLAFMLLLAVVAVGSVSCGGSTNSGGGGTGGSSITFPLTVRAQSNSATTNLQTISITVP